MADDVIGGSALDGFRRVAASPYLLGICAFMLLFTVGSTFLYNIQAEIMSRTFSDPAQRTSVFARIDLAVNTLTLFTQLFLTGRIMRWLGVGFTLAILPLLSVAGFLALGAVPVFAVFVVFQVLRRAGNFAVAVPTREVLYTVLPRRDKYKAKNFNDTFVYRAGDQLGAWSFAGLGALGLGTATLAWTMAPLAGVWLLVALWLGKRAGGAGCGSSRGLNLRLRTPRSPRDRLTQDQRVDVVRALVGVDRLQVGHVAHGRVLGEDAVGAEEAARLAGDVARHVHVGALGQTDLLRGHGCPGP